MKTFKKILIVVDIVIVVIVLINYFNFKKNKLNQDDLSKNNSKTESKDIKTQKINYKHFEFEIPYNINFSENSENTFELKTDDWIAYIEIIYDKDNILMNNNDKYYDYLTNNYPYYNLTPLSKLNVNNTEFNVCLRLGKNDHMAGVIGIADFHGSFIYQIDFLSLNEEFNPDQMKTVIDIMEKSKYNNSDNTVYNYQPAINMVK